MSVAWVPPRSIRELISRRLERASRRRPRARGAATEGACGFCGAAEASHRDALVPRMRIRERCGACPRLSGAEIPSCAPCHAHKRGRGLYELFRLRFPFDRRFAERIPPGLERDYLAAIAECHHCALTLDQRDIDGDGRLTVFDIDFVLHRR